MQQGGGQDLQSSMAQNGSVAQSNANIGASSNMGDQLSVAQMGYTPPVQTAEASTISVATMSPTELSFGAPPVSAGPSAQTSAQSIATDSTSTSSPTSQANTNEVLGMSGATVPVAVSPPQIEQKADTGSADTFSAMSAAPAFTAYTQVSLQDRPDFYAPRDIYRNHRLRDANFEMYRMSQTNNAMWKEMVDAQYGQ
jgi:hypothetical protein